MKKFIYLVLTISIVLIFSIDKLSAATVTWDGDGDNTNWTDPLNWDTDALPTATDDVDLNGATVILTANTQVQRVFIDGSGQLTVDNGVTLTIDGFSGDDEGLEVQTSATLINNGMIAISNISGTNGDGLYSKGTVSNNGSITIDAIGQHGVYVVAGTFTNETTGTITVTNVGLDDPDADYVYVDDANSGTLFGTLTNNGTITVTVTTVDDGIHVNDNSTFNNASIINISLADGAPAGDEAIFVEDGGIFNNNSGGVITINSSKDHGMATKSNGVINNNSGGTINIDAVTDDQIFLDETTTFTNGGIINLTNGTDVGLYVTDGSTFINTATGEVNVTNATDHGVYIQGNTTATAAIDNSGTITVQGGGASSDGLRLNTGGSLTNNAGASLIFNNTGADAIQLDQNTVINNSGTITVNGTSSAASGNEEAMELNGTGSTFNNLTGGLYRVTQCVDDGIEVNNGSVVNNDGDMRIAGCDGEAIETFAGFTFNNTDNATFAPGASPGEFELKGDLDLGTSTTTFEITGTTHTTEYDRIENFSGSTLTITNATMHLDWGAYIPNVGDKFALIDGAGLVEGQFSTVTNSNPGIMYTIDYTDNTEVEIEVTGVTLAVELIHFTGEKTERGLELNWATANEKDNEGFKIERSNNGLNWKAIGYVRGKGDSYELTKYTYLDKTPLDGKNYYRLKQNDWDGTFDYSNTVLLHFENEKSEFTFSPNPVEDMLYIDFYQASEDIEIQLYDSNGKILWTRKGVVQQIPFEAYAPGVYFLQTTSPSKRTIQKIIHH